MRSMNIASTGMLAQQLNVEVISNNIANMNTTGYKAQRAEFQDLLYQNVERPGATTSTSGTIVPYGIQIGVGVKPASVYRITEQGNLNLTENPYDIAIEGRGYLRIQTPTGAEAYTRAGALGRSAEGQLVTPDGYVVQPGITIPQDATDVAISPQGQVSVRLPGQTAPQQVGQLDLAIFVNEGGLEAVGDNLFYETAASGPAVVGQPGTQGYGTTKQGFLETANVNPVAEITSLITAQRAYEMNAKVISASDEMMSMASRLRG